MVEDWYVDSSTSTLPYTIVWTDWSNIEEVDGELLSSNTLTLTNTRKPEGTISVIKKWVATDLSSLYDDAGNPVLFPTIYLESLKAFSIFD